MKKITALAAAILMGTSLVGCTSDSERYTNYIQSVLDCTYYGKTEQYIELTESTEEDAQLVYQDEITYVTDLICYHFAVESSCISEETMEGYETLAVDILNKTKFTVDPAEMSGDSYHVTIYCEPIDFWDIAYDEVESFYTDEFGAKYEAAATQEELDLLEEEYAVNVLEILNGYVDKIGYGDPVKKIVEISEDEDGKYGITDQEWLDIDDMILGGN